MSGLIINAAAVVFFGSMGLFLATSVVALPFVAFDEIRDRGRRKQGSYLLGAHS
jgi:hypothetical protein